MFVKKITISAKKNCTSHEELSPRIFDEFCYVGIVGKMERLDYDEMLHFSREIVVTQVKRKKVSEMNLRNFTVPKIEWKKANPGISTQLPKTCQVCTTVLGNARKARGALHNWTLHSSKSLSQIGKKTLVFFKSSLGLENFIVEIKLDESLMSQ